MPLRDEREGDRGNLWRKCQFVQQESSDSKKLGLGHQRTLSTAFGMVWLQQKLQLRGDWAGNQVWRPRLVCSGKLWINVCSHSTAAPEKLCSSAHHPRNGFGRKLLRRKRHEGCGARAAWAVPMQTNLHQDTSQSSCRGSATCKETTAPREMTIVLEEVALDAFSRIHVPQGGQNFPRSVIKRTIIIWQQHCFFWSISEGNTEVCK